MEFEIMECVIIVLLFIFLSEKTPLHNSAFTGKLLYEEMLASDNEDKWNTATRMKKKAFFSLLTYLVDHGGLVDSEHGVCAGEKLMSFLYTIGQGSSQRATAFRFQHSTRTISEGFSEVLLAIMNIGDDLLERKPVAVCQPEIRDNYRFAAYFSKCIGALDGSHIAAVPGNVENKAAYRDRNGNVTQNLLAVVNFDMTFSFILAGWEGSAHDGRVLQDAIDNHGFPLHEGYYYLGDAGYSLRKHCLTPYRGVRYHLKEWARAKLRPKNPKELFNLRHASLRNVVERTFGVLKKRFRILIDMPSYSFEKQCMIVTACCLIHNFIRIHHVDGDFLLSDPIEDADAAENEDEDVVDDVEQRDYRDNIANAMWLDFQTYKNKDNFCDV